MYNIWFESVKFDPDEANLKIEGEHKAYFFGVEEELDSKEYQTEQFLYDFLCYQNRFPLYFTFTTYDDMVEEIKDLLDSYKITFGLERLADKVLTMSVNKIYSYHVPAFHVEVTNTKLLNFLLKNLFYLATHNNFFAISFTKDLRFIKELGTGWLSKKVKEKSIAYASMNKPTTIIKIYHDGMGFYLISNEEAFQSVDLICKRLPPNAVITHID